MDTRLLMFNGLLRFPVTLAYCFGGLVLGAFALSDPGFSRRIPPDKPDLMIPLFIGGYLPHGVVGVLVVALIAAWMSAYSSALNSLTAVTMEDFIDRRLPTPAHRYVPYSKAVLLSWGVEIGRDTSELQSPCNLVCRLLLEKKKRASPIHHQALLIAGCPELPLDSASIGAAGHP